MDLVKYVKEKQLKDNVPKLKPGDIVAVHQRIKEGSKERVQVFKGIVIRVKGGYGVAGSFTVRKVASGVGVEKSFLFSSPLLEKVVVMKQAKVRRAKLYYLRGRFGKATRLNLVSEGKETENLLKEVVGDEKEVEKIKSEQTKEKVAVKDEPKEAKEKKVEKSVQTAENKKKKSKKDEAVSDAKDSKK